MSQFALFAVHFWTWNTAHFWCTTKHS